MYHDCDTSEMGASRFAARDVHRIGILDIRIWNTDRHAGNILVRRPRDSALALSGLARLDSGQLELVPIDHGFCLPESYESPYFEWLFWPQVFFRLQMHVSHFVADVHVIPSATWQHVILSEKFAVVGLLRNSTSAESSLSSTVRSLCPGCFCFPGQCYNG